jgi:CHAT domain-containing protein/Tfp pilus assembly protein PilF
MKRWVALSLLISITSLCYSQHIHKQIEEMDTAFARGDYKLAAEWAAKIYPNVGTLTNDTLQIEFLSTYGSIYYRLEEYAKAGPFFLQAAEKAKKTLGENEYHYPLALFNLAACYKEEGRYAEAEPLYLKSLPALAPVFGQGSVEYTRCFYSLGTLYIDMGKYAEAESMCAAAVNFYKTALGQTSDDYLGALGSMGVIYMGQAKYDKAEEIFLSLKEYHSSLEKPSKVTLQILENNLGDLYRHAGDYDKAEIALIKAVELAGDSPAAASSLNNLALVQKALGKYAEAEASYRQALRIYTSLKKNDHPDYTNPLNNLGELYRTMGRLQEAVYAFEEVIRLRKKFLGTEHPNYANAVNNLALVEFAIGMYPEAEKHLLECRDIYKRTLGEKDKYYANCLNNLASVYKAQGKLQKAEENYKECIRIFKVTYGETSDKYGIYLGGLAGTYRQMKRYDEAIALTLQSLDILKKKLGENHYDHIETEYNLAETYREAGKYIEAEKHYHNSMKGYLLLIEKYFPYLSEKDKTAFYYNIANAFDTYHSFVIEQYLASPLKDHKALIARLYDNQVALKSLLLKESGKIRELVAASNNDTLKNNYREWMALRETIVQQYRLSEEDREAKGVNLAQLEVDANQLEQQVNIALKIKTTKTANKTVSWKDIQAALKPGEYAVEMVRNDFYAKGRWTDTVYYSALILSNTSQQPQLIILRNGKMLETKTISAYRTAMRNRVDDPLSYTAFWEPLKKYIGKASKIYFSADGVYQQLSLYTLMNPVTQEYLLDETDIALVTNTRDILQVSSSSQARTAEIFSYPDFGSAVSTAAVGETRIPGFPELKDLPGTKIESDSVKKILNDRGWTVKDHLQKEAAEDVIKKISNPQVLHIATHGYFLRDVKDTTGKVFGIESEIAKQNPLLRSGVILSGAGISMKEGIGIDKEDGILTAYEAAGLDLTSTDLVVLSACETGLGEILNGQGVYGLQRAFLLAGAKSLVMSLWMVSDAATQELMINFYREWLKNPAGGKQKALKTAQLKLREKYEHPYYWGPFVIVGD